VADKKQNLRDIEPEGSLFINRWWSGLNKNRSPLFTPISLMGIQIIQRMDTLWDGANMQVSPQQTLRRRYGFLKACSVAFGAIEWPLDYFSFENLAGYITPIVDTQTNVYAFSTTGKASIWKKLAGAGQSSFNSVNNILYWVDGVSAMKYVGPNLLIYSNAFGTSTTPQAPWTIGDCTLTTGQTDPNGGATASYAVFSVASTASYLRQAVAPPFVPVASNTFTFSVWLKADTGTPTIYLNITDQASNVVVSTQKTLSTIWTRYSVTGTALGTATSLVAGLINPSSTSAHYFIYGAQLEIGASATAYNQTTDLPQGTYQIGIVAPVTAPTLSFTSYGNAWQATHVYAVNNTITDSNGNLQTVASISSDYKSGVTAPTWATTAGSTTTDNHVVWACGGSNGLNPTVGYNWGYCYRSSLTDNTSTMSPISADSGVLIGQAATVSGARSTDPSVDWVDIYRTDDGGAVYYLDASVANPPSSSWTYVDTNQDSSLNTDLIAPLSYANNPPPVGASLLCWFAGRLWAISGNTLYYSGGPDTLNGVGEECWPIGNAYTLQGNGTAMAGTSQGLVTWTADTAFLTLGQNSSNFTVPMTWQSNCGVSSQNCVAQDGDNLYFYTTRGQAWSCISGAFAEFGFPIEAQLGAFTPANVYVAIHRSGLDEGVFVSDGSANIYRYSNVTNSWDTVMQPVGGCGAMASIELTTANWRLLIGRPTGAGYILERDLSTWSDDGSAYTAWATVGSLTVAPPRHVTNLESVLLQTAAVGTYPTVSVLLNEIADLSVFPATFVTLPNPVPDPPQLPATQSILTKRHDLKAAQSPLPSHVQHMQVKVVFATEAQPNEVYGLGVKAI
jgi:hypothetical protein